MLELEIDQNQMICKKILSSAEILHRRGSTTRQTHIGLFIDSVTLDRTKLPSLLIYKNLSYDTLTLIDPITSQDKTKRSPKTRKGRNIDELFFEGKQYESTFEKINQIIKDEDNYHKHRKEFFIIYGTLTNKRLFFILYDNDLSSAKILSKHLDFKEINKLRQPAKPSDPIYKKLYNVSRDFLKNYDQEESVKKSIYSINNFLPSSRFITIEDASLIQKIGKTGESLINKYLEHKKNRKEIKDYLWLSNKNPTADHDFEVTELNDEVKYIEVKSTKSSFETPFYWSGNEINLFLNKPNNYIIKRISHVFDDQNVSLRVGENMLSLHKKLNIGGINFEGSTVFPSKIDINWKAPISLKKLL